MQYTEEAVHEVAKQSTQEAWHCFEAAEVGTLQHFEFDAKTMIKQQTKFCGVSFVSYICILLIAICSSLLRRN